MPTSWRNLVTSCTFHPHGRNVESAPEALRLLHATESGLLSSMMFGKRGGYGLIDSVRRCRVYSCVMNSVSYKRHSDSPSIFFDVSSSIFPHLVQTFRNTKHAVQVHHPRRLGQCSRSSKSSLWAMWRTGLEWFEIMRLRIHMSGPGRILLPMRSR
jgi:hypothetical protein